MTRRGTRLAVVATVLLALLDAPGTALACSCVWGGPFTRVALGTNVIVLGEVRSYDRHSMEVAVVEVLKGIRSGGATPIAPR